MANYFMVLSVLLCFGYSHSKKSIPSYIEKCHRNDPNLDACFRKAVDAIKPHLLDGIPELYIPSLNPLVLPEAGLNSGDNFRAVFKNIEIYHANEFTLDHLHVDLDKLRVEVSLTLPKLRITSKYNINGRILILQLQGEGPADGNFTNVHAAAAIEGRNYSRHGKKYVDFDQMKLDLNVGKPVFRFENLFKDNPELNEQTNRIVNENVVDIIDELKPVIDKTVEDFVRGIVGRIFSRFTFDELFPK